jgi:hypothetical protein
MAKSLECDKTIAVRDRDGGCGEGALIDGFAQYGEGGCEGFVLPVESGDESWKGDGQGVCARLGFDLSGL